MIFTTPEKTDLEQGKTQLKQTPTPGKKKVAIYLPRLLDLKKY